MKFLRAMLVIGGVLSIGMQCTAVDRPISAERDGFIDEELLGRYVDDEWEFILTPKGDLEWFESATGTRALFRVWSTEIDGRRYLNFPFNRPYECIDCEGEQFSQMLSEPEAVFALLYVTDTESLEGPSLNAMVELSELREQEGEWVAYAFMDSEFAIQAIETDLINADCSGPCTSSADIRLTGSRRTLQQFISEHSDQLYLDWNIAWRQQD